MKRTSIFILQVLLWFMVSLVIAAPAHAAMTPAQQTQVIQTLEDTLFAVRYDQEAPNARLSRLEETVFGQAQSNLSVEARINKLQSALSPSAMGALSPLAKTSPASASSNNGQTTASKPGNSPQPTAKAGSANPANPMPGIQQAAKPTPGETDYPTVSQMEMKLFGKAFVQEDITQRLARLEKQVFKIQQNGALADRVDNLRLVVLGDTGTAANVPVSTTSNGYQVFSPPGSIPPQYTQLPSQGGYPPPQYTQIPGPGVSTPGYDSGAYPNANAYSPYGPGGMSAYQPSPYPGTSGYNSNEQPVAYAPPTNMGGMGGGQITPDMLSAINETEKQVLGHIYEQEPINTRLDRLEGKIFNTTSPEMSTEDRLQRVIAVSSAGGAPQSPQARAKSTFQTILPIILTILPMLLL